MKRNLIIFIVFCFFIIAVIIGYEVYKKNKIVEIHIGYQSVTAQTWGALIIKNQKFLEKNLGKTYNGKKVKVVWHDEISGSVINTNMIFGKVHLGFMGDMPLILNLYKSDTLKNYSSRLLCFDGKGINGKNQSILVPRESKIKSIDDLKGKTISTPIGSSAHFMLMKVLKENDMLNDVEIVHQDVALANQLLNEKKTDAFAIWSPYPAFLIKNDIGEILVDGTDSKIDYLAGVVVDYNWAKRNNKIITAFLQSLNDAHKTIVEKPEFSANIISQESGFDYDIVIKEVQNIKWESKINEEDLTTLEEKQKFLVELNQVKKFDVEEYIFSF